MPLAPCLKASFQGREPAQWFVMAKVDTLFAVPDREANELASFFRKQANEASHAGLAPHRREELIRAGLLGLQLVMAVGVIVATVAPLTAIGSAWLIRACAVLLLASTWAIGRKSATLDYQATGVHLRLWTLCERCIELLAKSNDPRKVHGYYLQHRAHIEQPLKGRRLIK